VSAVATGGDASALDLSTSAADAFALLDRSAGALPGAATSARAQPGEAEGSRAATVARRRGSEASDSSGLSSLDDSDLHSTAP
jgi:hypothetical protein